MGSEAHFRETLAAHVAEVFLKNLRHATTEARALAVKYDFREARTEPSIAFDLASGRLEYSLDAEPLVQRRVAQGQILYELAGLYLVRVKRLDENFQPANHESKQQRRMRLHQQLDGLPERLPIITLGPRISSTTGLPIDYVAVKFHPANSGVFSKEWHVVLDDLVAGSLDPIAPVLPISPSKPTGPARITSRRTSDTAKSDENGDDDRPTTN